MKGSKDRFLERAETREDGANPYPLTLRLRTFRSAPNRSQLAGGSMADKPAKCKRQGCPRVKSQPALRRPDAAWTGGSRLRRTVYRRAEGIGGPDPATLEAMLILRDQLVGDLSERSFLVLRGLLAGTTQRDLAHDLGITASAVSQRVRADGLAALVAADRALAVVA